MHQDHPPCYFDSWITHYLCNIIITYMMIFTFYAVLWKSLHFSVVLCMVYVHTLSEGVIYDIDIISFPKLTTSEVDNIDISIVLMVTKKDSEPRVSRVEQGGEAVV